MALHAVLKGGPYHGTQGEIVRAKPVLYFPETGGFAYVLKPAADPSVLVYEWSEEMSPAVKLAKEKGVWDPTTTEEMN